MFQQVSRDYWKHTKTRKRHKFPFSDFNKLLWETWMQLLHHRFLVLQKSFSLWFKRFLVLYRLSLSLTIYLDQYLIKSKNSIFEWRSIITFYGYFSVVKLKWILHLNTCGVTLMAAWNQKPKDNWLNFFTLFQPEASKIKHSIHFVTRRLLKYYLFQVITSRTRANYILRQPSKTSASSRYWLVRKIAQLCQINVITELNQSLLPLL